MSTNCTHLCALPWAVRLALWFGLTLVPLSDQSTATGAMMRAGTAAKEDRSRAG